MFGRFAPILRGLGFAMAASSFLVSVYYNVIVAWAIHYLVSGMQAELPWARFNHTTSDGCALDGRIYDYEIKDGNGRTSCCYKEVVTEHWNSTALNSTLKGTPKAKLIQRVVVDRRQSVLRFGRHRNSAQKMAKYRPTPKFLNFGLKWGECRPKWPNFARKWLFWPKIIGQSLANATDE